MSYPIYYVYVYCDPATGEPFYVGKGTGNRYTKHLTETKESTENYLKWCKFESLRNRGVDPIVEFVFRSDDEGAAYAEEARLIQHYGRRAFGEGPLTNLCIDNRPPTYAASLPRSEEYLENMSKAKRGELNPAYGKKPWNYGKTGYGTSKKGQKRKWVTDGSNNRQILASDPVPEGWHQGRSGVKRAKGKGPKKMWVNDGRNTKMILCSEEMPQGWAAGRLDHWG